MEKEHSNLEEPAKDGGVEMGVQPSVITDAKRRQEYLHKLLVQMLDDESKRRSDHFALMHRVLDAFKMELDAEREAVARQEKGLASQE